MNTYPLAHVQVLPKTEKPVQKMKKSHVFAGVCMCIVLGLLCISVVVWKEHRLPVDTVALGKLQRGATQEQVREVLGVPHQVWGDNRTWSYSQQNCAKIVYIVFDANFRYEHYDVDD
jgi:hypothetical protein